MVIDSGTRLYPKRRTRHIKPLLFRLVVYDAVDPRMELQAVEQHVGAAPRSVKNVGNSRFAVFAESRVHFILKIDGLGLETHGRSHGTLDVSLPVRIRSCRSQPCKRHQSAAAERIPLNLFNREFM